VRQALGVDDFVNADTIARGLSEFAPEQVAVAAGRIMLRRIRQLAAEHRSFAFETTLASRTFGSQLKRMQGAGYTLHLVFLWLPSADLAIERVKLRVKLGGHDVAPDVVRRRYRRGLSNFFNIYRPIADSWIMLDNSSRSSTKPIAWRNMGGPLEIVRSGPWLELCKQYENDIHP
jgi:predicted ABC-type ATPase